METGNYMVAEMQLTYRNPQPPDKRLRIDGSRQAYEGYISGTKKDGEIYFYPDETIECKEFVKVLLVNTGGEVVGCVQVAEGGLKQAYVDVRNVLQAALLSNASGIILSHNHPSGKVWPSKEDRELTHHLSQLCELMNVELLDHIILGMCSYYSFSDDGTLPDPKSSRKPSKLGEKVMFKV